MVSFITIPILEVKKLRLGQGKPRDHGSENGLEPRCPDPKAQAPPRPSPSPPPRALGSGRARRPEASAVLTLRLRLLRVTHSQRSGFGLFFVSPYGSIELLVINWTKRDQGTGQTDFGNPGTSTQWCGLELLPQRRDTYIGCAARNSQPCWWAQRMSHCPSSCSAALPADGPWHPPWK